MNKSSTLSRFSGVLSQRPQLRWPLDVQYIEASGERYVMFRDPAGIAPEPLIIPWGLLAVVSRFDGQRSLQDILDEGAPHGLTQALLETTLSDLDELLFLEGERVDTLRKQIADEFRASPFRPLYHRGKVYPEDTSELRKILQGYLSQAVGAGVGSLAEPERVIALVAPHIDYERGGNTYAVSYRVFQDLPRPDVIFLIGTSHQASNSCFHLSAKDLQTPFGILPCDSQLVAEINAHYTYRDLLEEEILHRTEHSLELQLPFLGFLLDGQIKNSSVLPTVVPILVGSFEPFFDLPAEEPPGGPRFHPEVAEFIATLGNLMRNLAAEGKSFLWVLGVDFAHVGQHFGDSEPLQADDSDKIEARDRLLLKTVSDSSADDLFRHVAEDRDKRRICGYSSLYTVLASLEHAGIANKGTLLDYQQAIDLGSDQLVSVASLVLERT